MHRYKSKIIFGIIVPALIMILNISCYLFQGNNSEIQLHTRYESISVEAPKYSPDNDIYPPVLHSDNWQVPVPLDNPVNSAGAEDNPVIMPDGKTLYYFFTPDVNVPPDKQILDGVTGIWVTKRNGGNWSEPQRVVLNNDLSLDSAMVVIEDTMWFISARTGNYRTIDLYTATYKGDCWCEWENAGSLLNENYQVGEFWVNHEQDLMIFHANLTGGNGGLDIWQSEKNNAIWGEPRNLGPVINSERDESHPYVSPDGKELFFTSSSQKGYKGPAIFYSIKNQDGNWREPQEILSNFAGDASVDASGNVYFTHHYYDRNGNMLEADIYVSYRK